MMEVEEKHVCKICDEVENNDITNWVWICDKGAQGLNNTSRKRCAETEFKSGDWLDKKCRCDCQWKLYIIKQQG